MDTKKVRLCSHLLPPPGGEVVRECCNEIERLRQTLNDAINLAERLVEEMDYVGTGNGTTAAAEKAEDLKAIASFREQVTPNVGNNRPGTGPVD